MQIPVRALAEFGHVIDATTIHSAPMTLNYRQPARLSPVHIPKPWGQEIWYSGMEERGESQVVTSSGTVGLSTYLEADPAASCAHADVLLLKILDPKPEPVIGDLYFETHEEKQEVYVVTHIDEGAWPDGVGGIRYGMDQTVRARYDDDAAFRAAYLEAVQRYETVRRAIDAGRATSEQQAREPELRAAMEGFTAMRALRVGDVVHVPVGLPHSLQHGVRVVEFQTQTYERLILSFAQEVVTQDHWDTEAGVAHMSTAAPDAEQFTTVKQGIERIAEFSHFNVWRIQHSAGVVTLDSALPYAVVIAVGGALTVADLVLQPEEAAFIPHEALAESTIVPSQTHSQGLIAAPGL